MCIEKVNIGRMGECFVSHVNGHKLVTSIRRYGEERAREIALKKIDKARTTVSKQKD